MAEIGTYVCSNRRCAKTLRLSRHFPVWKVETPRALRTPLPSKDAESFVTRYRSESYCASCNSVTEMTDQSACATCGSSVAKEHTNTTCPRCAVGTFSLVKLTVY